MTQAPPASPAWFVCERCNACCRWPGFVRVDEQAIQAISLHLQMTERDVVEHYCDLLPSRVGLTLKSREDHTCIFLENGGCRIHPVKPLKCRQFPNGWNFEGWRSQCHAVETAG